MPQINEYGAPDVEAQGPVGGVSPNLEEVSALGRSMQHFGQGITELGDVIYKKNEMKETADIYSAMAKKRNEWTKKIKDDLGNGVLDIDKVKEGLQTDLQKIGDQVETVGGQNYFERQAARLSGHIVGTASAFQAAQAGQKAQDDWQTGINYNSNSVHDDPSSFADVYNSSLEGIDALMKANPKMEGHRQKFINQMGIQLATAAARGWADQDPGANEKGEPNDNLGTVALNGGMFDDVLNSAQKENLLHYARTQDENRRVDKNRQAKVVKDNDEFASYQWQKANANAFLEGKISIQDLKDSPLLPNEKFHWRTMMEQQTKEETRTDPRIRNKLNADIYSGIVTNMDQVFARAKQGGLAPTDVMKAHSLINLTDDGQRENYRRKNMMATARKEISFKDMSGQTSAVGEFKIGQFNDEIISMQKELKDKGEDPKSVYDEKSPNFFGHVLKKYKPSPSEAMGVGARQSVDDALGFTTPETQNVYSTSPTGQINKTPQPPKKGLDLKKPGESAADFLLRKGK